MKKFAKKLICFTLCVLMSMSALTSCATIPFRQAKKDSDKLADKMEDAGYYAYEESGSYVREAEDELKEEFGVVGVKAIVMVYSKDYEEAGYFFICDNAFKAMRSKSGLKDYVKENQDDFDDDTKVVVKRSGKLVYMGTKQPWKDAKEATALGVVLTILAFTAVAVIALAIVAGAVIILIIVMKKMKKKKAAKLAAQNEIIVEAPVEEAPAEAAVEAPAEAPAEE